MRRLKRTFLIPRTGSQARKIQAMSLFEDFEQFQRFKSAWSSVRIERTAECFADLFAGDGRLAGNTTDDVETTNLARLLLIERIGTTNFDFQLLRRLIPDP